MIPVGTRIIVQYAINAERTLSTGSEENPESTSARLLQYSLKNSVIVSVPLAVSAPKYIVTGADSTAEMNATRMPENTT